MLDILGYRVSLQLVDANDPRLNRVMGRCSPGGQWIVVEATMCDDQVVSTIVHEMIEFGDHQLGLGLTEQQIQGVETIVVSSLQANGVSLVPLLDHVGR